MENTKLVNLLKTFNKTEIHKFKEFITSPYFNKNKNLIALADAVFSYYPDFNSEDFTEENVYSKIFGNEKFDYFKIKNIISDLFEIAINFLKISLAEKKDLDNEILLLNFLHDRKLDKLYSQREKKVSGALNNSIVKDEDNYLRQYQLERISTAHYKFDKSKYTFNKIQSEFDAFLDYSLVGLLRFYSKMLHNKNHGNINFNMEMFENIWGYAKDKCFENNPSCQIYKQIIALELSKEEKEYHKLIELKEKFSNNIPPEEHYYILLVQNSFAAYRLKLGDETYYKQRHNAFREMAENKFIDTDYNIFINFISAYTSACMADEYEWAEDFMKNFQKGISPVEEKSNTLYYCRGFMAYRQSEYGKALELFSKTNFKLYLMKVMVKSYSIRIYYEQDMIEQAISAVDAFRHYLKTENLMAENQKTAHYEFLQHLAELAKLKLEGVNKTNSIDLAMLKKRINEMSSNPLGAKNWLIEKVNRLK